MADFLAAAASDPGREREINEDRVLCHPGRGIFAVIDGVGGHAAGEVAADIAQQRLSRALSTTVADAASRVREAITLANNSIYEKALGEPSLHAMACVVTVALIEEDRLTVGHVGDTRLYKVRDGKIRQITRDHSPIGEREAAGRLTELEAMRHPRRNEIYRDVGTEPHDTEDEEFIDVYQETVETDCALVISSDGLTDLVPSARILELVEAQAGDPESSVRQLIAEANSQGGKDNISVIVVEGPGFAAAAKVRRDEVRRDEVRRHDGRRHDGRRDEARRDEARRDARPAAAPNPQQGFALHATSESFSKRLWRRARSALIGLVGLAMIAGLVVSQLQIRHLQARLAERESPTVLRVAPGNPDTFSSISQALDQALPGQVVEVAPGVYDERLQLRPGVALISRPAGAVVRLTATAGSTDPLVALTAEKIRGARVSGFRIIGDETRPLRVGVNLVDSEIVLENMEISGASVAAIDISGRDRSLVRFNHLTGNHVGIRVAPGAAPRIVQNLFVLQRLFGLQITGDALPYLIDNRFSENGTAAITGPSLDPRHLEWNDFAATPVEARFLVGGTPPAEPSEE